MAQIQLQKISPVLLTPATPEASDFLQSAFARRGNA